MVHLASYVPRRVAVSEADNMDRPSESRANQPEPTAAVACGCFEAWELYQRDPSQGLPVLLRTVPVEGREGLLVALEDLFFSGQNWRVAQHLALLHLDRLKPYCERIDTVRANYFAERACGLSDHDPRAQLALARVHWERRLSWAVLHDISTTLEKLPAIQPKGSPENNGNGNLMETLSGAYSAADGDRQGTHRGDPLSV